MNPDKIKSWSFKATSRENLKKELIIGLSWLSRNYDNGIAIPDDKNSFPYLYNTTYIRTISAISLYLKWYDRNEFLEWLLTTSINNNLKNKIYNFFMHEKNRA